MKNSRTLAVVSLGPSQTTSLAHTEAFDKIVWLERATGEPGALAARIEAVELASRSGADWAIVLGQGETLSGNALVYAAPALQLYDAVFGSVQENCEEGAVERLSRLAFDEPERLPHALLNWWMPDAHLVRTQLAIEVLQRVRQRRASNWKLDYLFDIWNSARCLKSAQPMLMLEDELQGLGDESRADVLQRLEDEAVFLPVIHGDDIYHLPYTGRNPGIEREQSRGLFFEAMELEELRKVVKPGAHVLDVGANTGNHTVFFAGPMKAASVISFEPLPAASDALRKTVEKNGLANVDLSRIGVGVGDREGRARLVYSGRGGLGSTSLMPDPAGDIRIAPLDSLVDGPVDLLKIDVEGMEMAVLAGASGLIDRWRPLIFIEIANRNVEEFMSWMKSVDYSVSRIFSDKGHANYLLVPLPR